MMDYTQGIFSWGLRSLEIIDNIDKNKSCFIHSARYESKRDVESKKYKRAAKKLE